ncbi:hypothetical protein PIROE2DRAFT_58092 [Piromyces sp. E2]|nr:hypothetical protein PIROE2DRAFT_58092 [Piromyces sp. E2]|eukprot:OUM68439.1 hypothetical protein PIROE2DRAFT_58092 [Piromyces sp. E2]
MEYDNKVYDEDDEYYDISREPDLSDNYDDYSYNNKDSSNPNRNKETYFDNIIEMGDDEVEDNEEENLEKEDNILNKNTKIYNSNNTKNIDNSKNVITDKIKSDNINIHQTSKIVDKINVTNTNSQESFKIDQTEEQRKGDKHGGSSFTVISILLIISLALIACAVIYIRAYYLSPSKDFENRCQPTFYIDGNPMTQSYANRNGTHETSPFLQPNMNSSPYLGSNYSPMSMASNNTNGQAYTPKMTPMLLPYPAVTNTQYNTMQSQYSHHSPQLIPSQSPYVPYQQQQQQPMNNNIYFDNNYNRNEFSDIILTDNNGQASVSVEPSQYSPLFKGGSEFDYIDFTKKME